MKTTLFCGDSVERLSSLTPESIDLIVTDPPYIMSGQLNNRVQIESHISRNDTPDTSFTALLNGSYWYNAWIDKCKSLLKQSGAMWICCNKSSLVSMTKAALDCNLKITDVLVWNRCVPLMGGFKALRGCYEMIALIAMPEFRIENRSLRNLVEIPWATCKKPHKHPAEKPVELMEYCIKASLNKPGVVLDPFCGSGTTGEAAIKLGHDFIGIDADQHWIDVTGKRLEAITNG